MDKFKIKWEGEVYEVQESQLGLFPGYEKYDGSEGKQSSTTPGAAVEENKVPNMDSSLENTSSDLSKIPTQIGDELQGVSIEDIKKNSEKTPTGVKDLEDPKYNKFSEGSIEIMSKSDLSDSDIEEMEGLFGTDKNPNFNFFNEKTDIIQNPGVIATGGMLRSGPSSTTQSKYFQYERMPKGVSNYSPEEIQKIEDKIKNEEGLAGDDLKKAVLSTLKQQFKLEKYKYNIDQVLSKDPDYKKEKKVKGFTSISGNINIPESTEIIPDYDKFASDKKGVKGDIANYMELSRKVQDLYEQNNVTGDRIKKFNDKIKDSNYEFKTLGVPESELLQLEDGRLISKTEYDSYKNDFDNYKLKEEAILSKIPQLKATNQSISQLGVAADLLSKDYDLFRKQKSTAMTGLGNIIVKGGTYTGRLITEILIDKDDIDNKKRYSNLLDKIDLKWDNYSNGEKNNYAPDIKFKDAFKDANFGRFLGQEVATQLPIFATMAASGGAAGLAGYGATGQTVAAGLSASLPSAGDQYARMTQEDATNPFSNRSNGEKMLISAGYGAAEGVFGVAPSYLLLRNTFNALSKSGRKVAQDGMRKYFGEQVAAPIFIESGGESLTSITQNILTGRPTFENVDHAAFSGGMFSVLMNSAPAVAGMYMQKFGDIAKYKEFRLNNEKINQIEESLLSEKNKTSVSYKALEAQKKSLQETNSNILSEISNKANQKISKEGFQGYMDMTSIQETLRSTAENVINDGELSSKDKKLRLEVLQDKFNDIQEARDYFRSVDNFGNEFSLLKGTDKTAYNNYIRRAKESLNFYGESTSSTDKIFSKASELYQGDKYDQSIADSKKITSLNNEFKSFETNDQLLDYLQKEGLKVDEKTLNKFKSGNLNGVNTTLGDKTLQLISKENSVKNERAGTGYHEIAHGALFESLGIKSEQYKPLADQIQKWLKVNDPKLYKTMFSSTGFRNKGLSITGRGKQSADITNAEEIVVNFLERVAEGKIKGDNVKNKTFLGSVAESMNLIAETKINFKGQNDAINLLINFGQRIKDGSLNKVDLIKLKLGLSDLIVEADKKVQSEPKVQMAASDSQAIQVMFENKGENAIMSIADNKYIKQEIKKLVNKYREVPKFSEMKEDFEMALISDPVYGILGSLRSYDAKRNPVLASHILARLKKKSITIANKLFETKFTEDVSEAKGVTDDVTDPEILNQRESLRISLGLTEDIINKVKNSVIKTFGTRLPSVKSKTFRKKLQKAFQVELKPTIAKFLGRGIEYKQFLQSNFDLLYSTLPQSTLNKRFKPFVEPVLDENGKQKREKTAEGNAVFRKKKIKNKEFVDYFLGDNVGRSTQGTRKTALAEGLATEIAFDATLDVLRDPEVYSKVQSIVEMQGEQFDDNYLSQVAKEIDRATDFQFSESAGLIIDLVNSLDGVSLEENFNVFWTALIAGQKAYKDMPNLSSRKGQALEYFVAKELEALVPGAKILNMSELNELKTGDTGVDIEIDIDGNVFGFEIKNSISDKIGGASGGKIKLLLGENLGSKIFGLRDIINDRFISKLTKAGVEFKIEEGSGNIITESEFNGKPIMDFLNEDKSFNRTETLTVKGIDKMINNYIKKGDQYIYFADKGWFYLKDNPLNIDIPSIYSLDLDTVMKTTVVKYGKQNNGKQTVFAPRVYLFFGKDGKVVNPNKIKESKQTSEVFTNTKLSESPDLNIEFNNIIENATNIASQKRYARAKATVAGKGKGKFDLIGIPPSAQDFMGLVYKFIGKGKEGDRQIKWIEKNITDVCAQAMVDISNTRVKMADEYNKIKKIVDSKDLNKKIPGEPFTIDQAVRVYIWTQKGLEIDGLSQVDKKELNKFVTQDKDLRDFANNLMSINDNGYVKPDKYWLAGNINTDLLQGLNTDSRKQALEKWQENVDIIFSETNLNKLEAAYGKNYRLALENMLGRMRTGTNRKSKGGDSLTNRLVDWINGSVGTIMFFNSRSAVLQTISAVNYLNWNDNNPLMAAKAFANQPQYWKDVMFLMNSDYLVTRRNGLKINVNEADIAEIAAESGNKAKAFIAKVLKLGFLPTQIADSFAISSGGATFYRNRVNSYIKDGMSKADAEQKAFLDFRELSEESQQSSRPDRISQQQASELGRVILAFANTPSQYARIIQKAASDLKNGRGDTKTNLSKIMYYGVLQNIIFNAMQQALFAIMFGDEPDDELLKSKSSRIANGMADSLLRGIGFHGAVISTLKNVILKVSDGGKAQDAAIELLNLSPPISSKIKKVRSAGRTFDWNKKEIKEKGFSLDNPAALALGNLVSASTNLPLDRGIKKLTNIKDALDTENEDWMRVANALGWAKWELEWKKPKKKKRKSTKKFKIY